MPSLTRAFRLIGQASLTGAVLFSGLNSASQSASAVPANTRFFQEYSWCDAQMLGKFWNIGPGDAKFDAGEMLQNGEQYVVETKLSHARQDYAGQGLCSFADEGYSYEDMVAVADYWQTRSVFEAKVSINNKLEAGLHREARDVVQRARQQALRTAQRTERIAFESLNRDGKTLGYFVRSSDGGWVEQSASGQNLFFFREIAHTPFEATLIDDSRGIVINLDHHMNVIRYKLSSGNGEFKSLYAMSL